MDIEMDIEFVNSLIIYNYNYYYYMKKKNYFIRDFYYY